MSLDLLQYPAAAIGILGAWLVGSLDGRARFWGFLCFLASNLLIILWAFSGPFYAIVFMQACYFVTSVRGALSNKARMP